MEDNDAQLQIKKRARRRLVGAVFFASVVAIILPMVMDQEPRPPVQDVEIRIPGQDEKPFAPKFAAAPAEKVVEKAVEKPAEKSVAVPAPAVQPAAVVEKPAVQAPAPEQVARPTAKVVETVKDKPAEKTAAKPEKTQDKKAPEKAPEKPAAKPAEKTPEKPADPKAKPDEAKRAAAILAGGANADAKPAAKGGEFLVLIGAFSSDDNVRILKAKLAEQGIKAFTEPLDTPQGKKTRVRAGPFPSREAADKALDKMKKIGVSGVVAAKP
jgi:DedD protein